MSREDQYSVILSIDGVDYGVWDKMSGGGVESEEVKFRPGGMGSQISLGGSKAVSNITLSRLYSLTRDHPLVPTLMAKAGKGSCIVTKQPLDLDGLAVGIPLTYSGKLMNVTPPDHDSESSDPAMIELEISTDGSVT